MDTNNINISLRIRSFQNAIKQYMNQNDLPWEIKRMALKEIYADIEAFANTELQQAKQKYDEMINAQKASEEKSEEANE